MERPRVISLGTVSVDSRIALVANRTQWEEMADPRAQASESSIEVWTEARRTAEELHHPQAWVLGSGSLVREGEPLRRLPPAKSGAASLYGDFLPDDVVHREEHTTWLVVVDSRGRLRSGYKGTDEPGCHMLHLVSRKTPPAVLAFLQRERIPYLVAGDDRVDLRGAMGKLKTKLGVKCLVSEAVGRLNGALLRAGLIDEVDLVLRPELIGGETAPILFQGPNLADDEWPTRLRLLDVRTLKSQYVWLRYEVVRK